MNERGEGRSYERSLLGSLCGESLALGSLCDTNTTINHPVRRRERKREGEREGGKLHTLLLFLLELEIILVELLLVLFGSLEGLGLSACFPHKSADGSLSMGGGGGERGGGGLALTSRHVAPSYRRDRWVRVVRAFGRASWGAVKRERDVVVWFGSVRWVGNNLLCCPMIDGGGGWWWWLVVAAWGFWRGVVHFRANEKRG